MIHNTHTHTHAYKWLQNGVTLVYVVCTRIGFEGLKPLSQFILFLRVVKKKTKKKKWVLLLCKGCHRLHWESKFRHASRCYILNLNTNEDRQSETQKKRGEFKNVVLAGKHQGFTHLVLLKVIHFQYCWTTAF